MRFSESLLRTSFLLLVWAVSIVPLFSETELYRSNEIGMTLEQISQYRRDEFEYVLSIEALEEKKTLTLFKNGEEYKKWVKARQGGNQSIVTYFEKKDLISETVYSENRVGEERFYSEEQLTELHKYHYRGGALSHIVVSNSEGEILYELHYLHTSSGRLKQVKKVIPEMDTEHVSNYLFSGGNLIEEWHGDEKAGDFFRFTDEGTLLSHEQWSGTALTAIEEQKRGGGTAGTVTVSENIDKGIVRYTYRNEEGRVIREKAEKNERLLEEIQFTYEGENLGYKRRHTPGLLEEWEYVYDGGELNEVKYSKNGDVKVITVYTSNETYHEDIYRKGKPFLRVFFEDNVKVKEEFIYSEE